MFLTIFPKECPFPALILFGPPPEVHEALRKHNRAQRLSHSLEANLGQSKFIISRTSSQTPHPADRS